MRFRVPALAVVLCVQLCAQSSSIFIETIAGSATYDNRPALQTPLVQPEAVWVQPNGDIFISDGNFVVRRIRNGLSTIVAGGGSVIDNSLPIPARSAKIDYPNGLAGGPSGELYISDVNHNRVQRLNADGTIVTVVGKGTAGFSGDAGRGTAAELSSPRALALSAAGDLFIADKDNAVVRKYNIRSGIITTYAGTGRVGFSGDGGPALAANIGTIQSLAVDAGGNLYLDDTQFDDHDNVTAVRIRRVSTDGIIRTVAGAGPPGATGDEGPAVRAQIKSAFGLAVDAKGNLYIADVDRIRVVTPDGIIHAFAGQTEIINAGVDNIPATQAYLNTPGAIALDADGNVYFPESTGELVRKIDARTKLITTVAGTSNRFDGSLAAATTLNKPTSVATDRLGNLYLVDSGHFSVRKIDAVTGAISTFAGDGKYFEDNQATYDSLGRNLVISVDGRDRLLIADEDEKGVYAVDLANRELTVLFDGSADNVLPTGVAGDAAGNVYISDWNHDQVLVLSPDGKPNVFAGIGYHGAAAYGGDGGPAVQADLSGPRGLALDAKGRLLICDTDNHVVRIVDPATGIINPFAGDHIDNSDYDTYPAVQASLRSPVALALDSDGWVYIADKAAHQIRVVTTDGYIYTAGGGNGRGFGGDGGPAILSLMDTPLGVAATGIDIYVSDSFNYRIRHLFYRSVQNDPVVDPQRLTFRATQGGAVPSIQLLTINSSYLGLNLNYTVERVDGSWLSVCTGTQGTDCFDGSTPDLVGVLADPTNLEVGRYSAAVLIHASGSPDLRIPVDFIVDPPNVVSSVTLSPSTVRLSVAQNSSSAQRVEVTSAGKPLSWSIRRQTDSPWLKFSVSSGITPATVDLTIDSTDLRPGIYPALSYLVVDGGSTTLLVTTLTVTDAKATMQLDHDSMLFEAVEGASASPSQPLRVYNTGPAPLSWQIVKPAVDDQRRAVSWVASSTPGGVVQQGAQPSLVNISVDPAGLRAGVYSVPLVVTAPGANGAPQVLGVRLRVLPADTRAQAVFDKTALLFRASPGASVAEQTVELSSTGGPLSFTSSVRTDLGGQWLSVTPPNGSVLSSAQRLTLRFRILNTALAEGVYTGGVKLSFTDGSVRQINVTMILRAGAGAITDGKSRSAGCDATRQVLLAPSLTDNFALNVGWPIPMQAQVFDDCGAPSAASTVSVTFDNGDPPMTLKNLSGGNFAGTWTPASAGSGAVSLTMQALRPGLAKGEWKSTGRLTREASTPPILAAGGVLNAASRVNTSLLAPGGRLILQGANFPAAASDAAVLIGGSSAKVVFSSAAEMQVVAPAQLDGISQTYVIVNANGFSTSPQTVSVVPADPGLYPLPDGTVASRGASLTVTATGLGAVDTTGRVTAAVTAKLGDLDAPVTSATLPAGADGVYQLRITIPAGASGALPLTITQNAITSNQITVNVQ
jgi:uncharacterized protein (TIGR03437 family)